MAEQTQLGAAVMFMAMWVAMMVAMMLPSLLPALRAYHRSLGALGRERRIGLASVYGTAYFAVWTLFGAGAYLLTLAAAETRWLVAGRFAALATGAVLVLAGCFQLTTWKARRLTRCRTQPDPGLATSGIRRAGRLGFRLGVQCSLCCLGFMLILLVAGTMNLGLMLIIAAAITGERLAPKPEWIARGAGAVMLAAGALTMVRAMA